MANQINYSSKEVTDYKAAINVFLGSYEDFIGKLDAFKANLSSAWTGEAAEAHILSWTNSKTDAEAFKENIEALIKAFDVLDSTFESTEALAASKAGQ